MHSAKQWRQTLAAIAILLCVVVLVVLTVSADARVVNNQIIITEPVLSSSLDSDVVMQPSGIGQ